MRWPRPHLSQSGPRVGSGRSQVHPESFAGRLQTDSRPTPDLGYRWGCGGPSLSSTSATRVVHPAVPRPVMLEVNQSPER